MLTNVLVSLYNQFVSNTLLCCLDFKCTRCQGLLCF